MSGLLLSGDSHSSLQDAGSLGPRVTVVEAGGTCKRWGLEGGPDHGTPTLAGLRSRVREGVRSYRSESVVAGMSGDTTPCLRPLSGAAQYPGILPGDTFQQVRTKHRALPDALAPW